MQYHEEGSGPAVVLIHGLFGDRDNLAGLGRVLLTEGYRVIRVDLRNHGQSAHQDTMTFAEMAEDLEQLRQRLALPQMALVGHSLGGKVAMTYAQAHPQRVTALVVADIAPVAYSRRHDTILATLASIDAEGLPSRKVAQQQLMAAGIDGGTALFLTKNLKPRPEGGFRWQIHLPAIVENYPQLIGALPDNAPYPGPTLFLKGEHSDYLLPAHQGEVVARFPQAKARVIAGAGHWLHADKPQLFNRQVVQFLAGATGR
ncbi:alpha/beta fold hydrolase [Ferrimonas balearica]|uniref:alpha/beta fold hydrolase n=1 Tax=Ferrimonas balearica TaxID=44012 RepID=UPI001C99E36D|nr:alpha/beta fold hydrolase [Ferrimonas balearica]MBY5992062.1 alpha/beta fold hydrolase [Ferrimonas balearica]